MKIAGPYGSYPAGTIGATMNALSEQEGLSTHLIDGYVFVKKGIQRRNDAFLLATYEWKGNEVTFTWTSDARR